MNLFIQYLFVFYGLKWNFAIVRACMYVVLLRICVCEISKWWWQWWFTRSKRIMNECVQPITFRLYTICGAVLLVKYFKKGCFIPVYLFMKCGWWVASCEICMWNSVYGCRKINCFLESLLRKEMLWVKVHASKT